MFSFPTPSTPSSERLTESGLCTNSLFPQRSYTPTGVEGSHRSIVFSCASTFTVKKAFWGFFFLTTSKLFEMGRLTGRVWDPGCSNGVMNLN